MTKPLWTLVFLFWILLVAFCLRVLGQALVAFIIVFGRYHRDRMRSAAFSGADHAY